MRPLQTIEGTDFVLHLFREVSDDCCAWEQVHHRLSERVCESQVLIYLFVWAPLSGWGWKTRVGLSSPLELPVRWFGREVGGP